MSANAAADVAARLRQIAARAESEAPRAAVEALSAAGQAMTRFTLGEHGTHALGTPTPSDPGSPPAMVSGDLRDSVRRSPPVPVGPGRCSQVMKSQLIYGSVHEFGPVTIQAKNFPQLGNPTVGFFGKQVKIPRRPWMKPSMELLVTSRIGTRAASAAFLAVIDI